MLLEAGEVIGNMRAPAYTPSRPGGWSFSASCGFHMVIGLALLLAVTPRRQGSSSEDSVTVDVLTQQQFEAASRLAITDTRAAPLSEALPEPATASPVPDFAALPTDRRRPEPSVMVKATHLQSAKVLADPRSAKARKALGQLAPSERIVQLCNIEAMEQVHIRKAALKPDFLVAYAMADTELSGQKLKADGGAFRSKRRWYNIGFICEVTPDLKKVVSFAFAVGSEIPKGEWADHNLLADDGPAD
ncbi:DUF930 domain-containing protein [Rhizobium sp. PL01]|uniref:DUF930 domain-containing protein n=1 Tax=Rhizobium sp. PL01 TaxID=3085631 RepID=UPI0029823536|nr:DUF930 domain-containing protein [Rhizobium sp. PL01]MDW5314916.1 DUF930 domain-containing protein [Rhizobium sp. PL01]